MPEEVFTASPCLTGTGPGSWALSEVFMQEHCPWEMPYLSEMDKFEGRSLDERTTDFRERRRSDASMFGVDPARLPSLTAWIEERALRREWWLPGVFTSSSTPLQFIEAFQLPTAPRTIGLALTERYAEERLAEGPITSKYLAEHPATDGIGFLECLRRRVPPDPGGIALGYEILGEDYPFTPFHSWLCNDLEASVYDTLDIAVNEFGLITDYGDADRTASWIIEEEQGEPVPWTPYLLTLY